VAFKASGGWSELAAPPTDHITVTGVGADQVTVDTRRPGHPRVRLPRGAQATLTITTGTGS
jgi:endoglycosylceramidase